MGKIGAYRAVSDKRNMDNDYIALIDLDFTWNEKEIKRIITYWNSGYHITEIAKKVDRIVDEVALLIIDLARKERIEPRKGGVFGDKSL